MSAPVYIALVHYPIVNKHGALVTTSITNFDLHDLARTSTTYGIENYFVVTPNEPQKAMAAYIKDYWREGFGATFNPDRKDAFANMEIASNLAETCLTIQNRHDKRPRLIATTAKRVEKPISFGELRQSISQTSDPVLLVFGTGWGLASSVLEEADAILEPIYGPSAYNHLPVRSAVAIILDRLLAPSRTN